MTIDASVLVRATNPAESGQQECEEVLAAVGKKKLIVVLPTFAIPELAGVLGRRRSAPGSVEAILDRIRQMPGLTLVPLDEALGEEAAELAIETKLRGADAIYIAAARRYGATLVTVDEEQRSRAPKEVTAVLPAEFLAAMEERR